MRRVISALCAFAACEMAQAEPPQLQIPNPRPAFERFSNTYLIKGLESRLDRTSQCVRKCTTKAELDALQQQAASGVRKSMKLYLKDRLQEQLQSHENRPQASSHFSFGIVGFLPAVTVRQYTPQGIIRYGLNKHGVNIDYDQNSALKASYHCHIESNKLEIRVRFRL